MADQTLEIQIKTLAELSAIKAAVKELTTLKKVSNDTQKEVSGIFSGLSSSLGAIPKQLVGIGAGFLSFRAAANLISESVSEAIQAEKALSRLTAALDGTNEATAQNIKLFQDFADAIQSTTRFEDDLVIEQLAVAKSFGLTNTEAKKLVETATDLAAVTGKDLNSATDDLLKSLSGQLPRELKLLGREFSNLTEEQLKSGAALDLINSKFGTRAEGEIKTLSGAYAQFTNTLGNAREEIGKSIISTGILQNILSKLTSAINREFGFEKPIDQLSRLRKELELTGDAARKFIINKQIIEIEAKLKNDSLKQVNEDVDDQIKNSKVRNFIPVQVVVDQGAKQKFLDDLKKVGLSATEIAKQDRDARLKELNKIFGDEAQRNNLSVNDKKAALDAKLRIEREYSNKILQSQKEQTAKEAQELKIRQDIFKNAASNIGLAFVNIFKGKAGPQEIQGALAGIGQQVTQGAQGTRNILGSAAQAGGNLIAPGLGDVAGPIITELAKGKEAAKAFVTEFLNAIPEMISGLVEGIISAALTFAEQVPVIVDKIISDLPRLISAVIDSLPQIIIEFQNLMPQVAVTFASSLIEQAPNIAQAIIKSIANTPGNAAKSAGRLFKFADGGQGFAKSVPGGFGNGSTERFPAILGSGELVVDRSTAFKLKDFLNNKQAQSTSGEKSSNDSLMAALNRPIIVQIDGREVARATRNQIKSGFVLA